jgi:hypothetical protein
LDLFVVWVLGLIDTLAKILPAEQICWQRSGEVWGGCLLHLAEIHEKKNEKGVAAGYLRRFVALLGQGQALGEDLARTRRKLTEPD